MNIGVSISPDSSRRRGTRASETLARFRHYCNANTRSLALRADASLHDRNLVPFSEETVIETGTTSVRFIACVIWSRVLNDLRLETVASSVPRSHTVPVLCHSAVAVTSVRTVKLLARTLSRSGRGTFVVTDASSGTYFVYVCHL